MDNAPRWRAPRVDPSRIGEVYIGVTVTVELDDDKYSAYFSRRRTISVRSSCGAAPARNAARS